MFVRRPPCGSHGSRVKKPRRWKQHMALFSQLSQLGLCLQCKHELPPRLYILQHEPPLQKDLRCKSVGHPPLPPPQTNSGLKTVGSTTTEKGEAFIRFYRISSSCLPKCTMWQVLGRGSGHPGCTEQPHTHKQCVCMEPPKPLSACLTTCV